MKQFGAESGVVNASGDLTTWGLQPNGNQWTVGIATPDLSSEVFSCIWPFQILLVATSGQL